MGAGGTGAMERQMIEALRSETSAAPPSAPPPEDVRPDAGRSALHSSHLVQLIAMGGIYGITSV